MNLCLTFGKIVLVVGSKSDINFEAYIVYGKKMIEVKK